MDPGFLLVTICPVYENIHSEQTDVDVVGIPRYFIATYTKSITLFYFRFTTLSVKRFNVEKSVDSFKYS